MSNLDNLTMCPNGHVYDSSLNECPFCPSSSLTGTIHDSDNNFDKTRADEMDKTQVEGTDEDLKKTDVPEHMKNKSQPEQDLGATYVKIDEDSGASDEENAKKARSQRKIVGWLVSYTLDSFGRDYRVYEGRNTIGKSVDNQIVIPDDPTISNHHLTLLYNNNQYFISDEMSGNGTMINDVAIRPKEAIDLKDGDIIKIGNSTLLFRTSLINQI